MKQIPLTKGKVATVSNEDYEYLNQWNWYTDTYGYAVRNSRKHEFKQPGTVLMHRVVAYRMGLQIDGLEVDHINNRGSKSNNQRRNLRVATRSQNQSNRQRTRRNKSGFKGVSWSQSDQTWCARIVSNGKRVFLGSYPTAKEAAAAYDHAAKEMHGKFSNTNNVATVFRDRRHSNRNNTSGYRGVSQDSQCDKWKARLAGRNLGRFDTKEEAARAYNEAALKYFGPQAYQNKL